jgi:hypothetical protein
MASGNNPKHHHICFWQNSGNCSPRYVYAWYIVLNVNWPGLYIRYEMLRFHDRLQTPVRHPKDRPRIIWLCDHHGRVWESAKWGRDKGHEYDRWSIRESLYHGYSMRMVGLEAFDSPSWTYETFHKMKEAEERPRPYYFVKRFNLRNGEDIDDNAPLPSNSY